MNAVMPDTLAISERLKQAGLSEPAAKAVAVEIVSTIEVQAATKADVREIVHAAVDDLRKEMWRMMPYSLGVVALMLTALGIALKLIH